MSAEMIFNARIAAWIPEATDMDDLADSLDEIANHMTLEIDLAQGRAAPLLGRHRSRR
jgi:glycine cleavage system regulatory protein